MSFLCRFVPFPLTLTPSSQLCHLHPHCVSPVLRVSQMATCGLEADFMLQVPSLEADVAAACQAPAPVITFEAFQTLCTASALQVRTALISEEQRSTLSRQNGIIYQ